MPTTIVDHQQQQQQQQHHQQQQQQQQQGSLTNKDIKMSESNSMDESDPSLYQLLQTAIQLIYQTRSRKASSHVHNNHPLYRGDHLSVVQDIFNVKSIEGGTFQTKQLLKTDLDILETKDINLDYVEINEINRDLSLWCEHIQSSPLKFDIFVCQSNPQTDEFTHTLLERWMFSYTKKPLDLSFMNLNVNEDPNRMDFIMSPPSNPATPPPSKFKPDNNNMNQQQQQQQQPFQLYSNHHHHLQSSMLIKSLYYFLHSMPLYSTLQSLGQDIKIKYGVSKHFPPPLNFKPQDFTNLVKLNFPTHDTSQGTITLSVQFPNIPIANNTFDSSNSFIVIYPSRSCTNNLLCHNIPLGGVGSGNVKSSSLVNVAATPAAVEKKQQQNDRPSSPSSAPISIRKSAPNSPLLSSSNQPSPPQTTRNIDIKSNNNCNSNNNNNNIINNNNGFNQQQQHINQNNSITLSPTFFNNHQNILLSLESLTPPSLSSFSPIQSHFKSFGSQNSPASPPFNSPTKFNSNGNATNNILSPPSSPYRVGHRPLFFDGLSPSSLYNGYSRQQQQQQQQQHIHSPLSPSQYHSQEQLHHHFNQYQNHHMSFGSFQESLLTGNMGNTPSTVFDGYLADLGVSGKDYIPPHKKISFSAMYYHIDHETPYVADIDLGKKGYRVPSKGLIQLTLFNPHHTPIKTFLVNFDLSDMGQDTKTFIRQKILSFEINNNQSNNQNNNNNNNNILSSPLSLSSPMKFQNSNNSNNLLKYAIHLRFICKKKKKYLYKNIRVVFPNRIPDEMEQLKVIYEYPPDPKYFPFFDNS
ncbi:hypothetical protein CYY_000062 [Polysphondylium violaceum]|uniref:Atos-like conserved domain-containing protein n=1 Tax=Polysphondylium violaceum TaxID=133409 RepID=A0A8J4UXN4_9MYCE|nr:hypothetical protein CYY_000062 [Polysphondylium violaceum]